MNRKHIHQGVLVKLFVVVHCAVQSLAIAMHRPSVSVRTPGMRTDSSIVSKMTTPVKCEGRRSRIKRAPHNKTSISSLDRRNICLYRQENPAATQDQIAAAFNVSRSSVSKILKHQSIWLHPNKVVSPRFYKQTYSQRTKSFECALTDILRDIASTGVVITDSRLRIEVQSLLAEENKELHPDCVPSFKASPSWITQFKRRSGLRRGTFGDGGETILRHLSLSLHGILDSEDVSRFHYPSDRLLASLPDQVDDLPEFYGDNQWAQWPLRVQDLPIVDRDAYSAAISRSPSPQQSDASCSSDKSPSRDSVGEDRQAIDVDVHDPLFFGVSLTSTPTSALRDEHPPSIHVDPSTRALPVARSPGAVAGPVHQLPGSDQSRPPSMPSPGDVPGAPRSATLVQGMYVSASSPAKGCVGEYTASSPLASGLDATVMRSEHRDSRSSHPSDDNVDKHERQSPSRRHYEREDLMFGHVESVSQAANFVTKLMTFFRANHHLISLNQYEHLRALRHHLPPGH